MQESPPTSDIRRAGDRLVGGLATRFTDALRVGDGAVADAVVQDGIAAGLSAEVLQSLVIGPAMVVIGELWEARCIDIAHEHLATSISHRALITLFERQSATAVKARSRERVLLAAVEGQHHTLGLRMAADVLEGAGFDVLYLGESVPTDSLSAAVALHRPAVVGLTFGLALNVCCLAEALWGIHKVSAEIRVVLGGRAVPPEFSRAYPVLGSTVGIVSAIEAVLAGPAQQVPSVVERVRRHSTDTPPSEGRTFETDTVAAGMAQATERALDIAREQVRRAATYRDLAFRDPLTDLANRRAFDEALADVAQESSVAGALLMIDVDGFKSVNDQRGHQAGDLLLRAIANAVRRSVRPGDLAARFGGDEFAVLLPTTTMWRAREIADRIRSAVADDPEIPVTVSVGGAPLSGDARGAVLNADTALYAAKTAGRDRVNITPTPDRLRD